MYQLDIKVDNDFKNNIIFVEFEELDEVMEFIKVFEKHSNSVCQYTISFS